ncbi:MAG: efflux RND transporter permease subunit [Gammaproteobacteria bacterium]|nr:efflux RND transporter permease subunit [Gammaproteobacteria bacterium]
MSRSSLTEFALANPLYVWVVVLACVIGGLAGGQRIAQLEDPPYPIKIAFVFTEYPGASALEVEQEVTEVMERSIQELPWIEKIVSRSLPGRSEIEIELNHSVSANETGQIWDELRRRVAEGAMRLPGGLPNCDCSRCGALAGNRNQTGRTRCQSSDRGRARRTDPH